MRFSLIFLVVLILIGDVGFAKGRQDSLTEAAGQGDLKRVKELVAAGADINGVDLMGRKGAKNDWPLLYAASGGHADVVRFLLEQGAEVDQQMYGMPNLTALMASAQQGHQDIVEILLEHGADPLLRDSMGRTALELAEKYNHTAIVKLLQKVTITGR